MGWLRKLYNLWAGLKLIKVNNSLKLSTVEVLNLTGSITNPPHNLEGMCPRPVEFLGLPMWNHWGVWTIPISINERLSGLDSCTSFLSSLALIFSLNLLYAVSNVIRY